MSTIVPDPVRLPLGPADAGMPMTLDEFEDAEFEAGYRYELINGILVATPLPLKEERDANEELGRWLRNHQEVQPRGMAIATAASRCGSPQVGGFPMLPIPPVERHSAGHHRECQ